MSSQMGCPEGASAECGRDIPRASPTTWEVAAVPRKWQPPPGDAQVRQPAWAASSSVIAPCAKRAPMVWTLAVSSPSSGSSATPPGTSTPGSSPDPASAIIMAGKSFVTGRKPDDAAARWQRSDQAPEDDGCVVPVRQAVEHSGSALRAPVAGVGAVAGERDRAQSLQFLRRGLHQEPDLPVAGVVAERDRLALGVPDPSVGAEQKDLLPAQVLRLPAHSDVVRPGEQFPRRPFAEHFGGERQGALGTRRPGVNVIDRSVARIEDAFRRVSHEIRLAAGGVRRSERPLRAAPRRPAGATGSRFAGTQETATLGQAPRLSVPSQPADLATASGRP